MKFRRLFHNIHLAWTEALNFFCVIVCMINSVKTWILLNFLFIALIICQKKKKFGRKIMQVCQLGMTEAKTEWN